MWKVRNTMGWQKRTDNNKFLVSTMETFDNGWETLVFPIINGAVDYSEQDVEHYTSAPEAESGHTQMFQKWNSK